MRKPFLDNLRYGIVLLVIVYHVCYLFNSVGVITNVVIPGIPAIDVVEYALYPWFMPALFVISGICARYTLERKTDGQFLRSKLRRQLVPSVAVIFLIGWAGGWVTNQYTDMFAGNGDAIPGAVKYLIWCFAGIGPMWFLHELLLAEIALVLLRQLDRKERLWQLGEKVSFPAAVALLLLFWGSARILNTPVIEVYRNGIYLFSFLAGYLVFSHERVQAMLAERAPLLVAAAGLLGITYTVRAWGENYAEPAHLKAFLTNAYGWMAILAALGAGKRWLNRETSFTRYFASRSFGFYVLHYPLLVLGAWFLDRVLHLPVWSMYLLLAVWAAAILPPVVAIIKKIPVLRTLVLGGQ